jgi:hypothetical protein
LRAEGAFSVLSREHRACVPRCRAAAPLALVAHSNGPFAFLRLAFPRSFYIGFDRGGHPVYLEYFGATQWLKARPARSPERLAAALCPCRAHAARSRCDAGAAARVSGGRHPRARATDGASQRVILRAGGAR